MKTFLLFLLPQQTEHDKQRLRAVSHFFYCSQSTTNNDQFRMNTQDLLSHNLIKHRDGHKEQNTGWPAWQAFEREGEGNEGARPRAREEGGGERLQGKHCFRHPAY